MDPALDVVELIEGAPAVDDNSTAREIPATVPQNVETPRGLRASDSPARPDEDIRPSALPESPAAAPRFSIDPVTTQNTRTVAPESEIEVRLPGVSWLFLGSEPPVTFLGRETDPGAEETLFRFRVPETAELRFEAQDLASGVRTRHEETVRIAAGDSAADTEALGNVTAREDGPTRSGQSAETPRDRDDGGGEVTPPTSESDDSDDPAELTYLDYLRDPEHKYDPEHHAAIVAAIANDQDALRELSSDMLTILRRPRSRSGKSHCSAGSAASDVGVLAREKRRGLVPACPTGGDRWAHPKFTAGT